MYLKITGFLDVEPEDGGSMVLRNVGTFPPDYMASQYLSNSPPWESGSNLVFPDRCWNSILKRAAATILQICITIHNHILLTMNVMNFCS
jgi:hypothetical protein